MKEQMDDELRFIKLFRCYCTRYLLFIMANFTKILSMRYQE
jgi:hypothetical protein